MQSVLIAVGPRQTAQDLTIPFQEWRHHAFNGFQATGSSIRLGIALVTNTAASPGDSDPKIERAQLAPAVCHFDVLKRHADNRAALSHHIAARYHFYYLRLRRLPSRRRTGVR
ncbi:RAQPRD family integrative conjugative element protein [Pseudomonas chlororaphis]